MGRLTGETLDGETACYSYDHAGNRLTRTGAGRTEHYRYNSRNQLTELDSTAGTVRYEYDPAGSLTAGVHTAQGGSAAERTGYTYDAYNRNTSVCGAGYVQQNHYDAEGLRYAVTGNGETTNFVYRNDMPVSELDADKNPLRGYVLGNEYISQVDGTSFGYYLNDEQGSVRYLTGSDGSIRNHYRYSAFGETITAEETVPNRLRYNEQMADGLIGLYYLRARYYNASLGRFTQEGVIYNDGLNLYAYCNSNPVMYSDPSGFAKQCDPKVGGEKDSKSGTGERLIPGMEGGVTGGDSIKLGKNMMESMGLPRGTNWKGHQAQHIIPAEMANHPVLQRIGMDLDDASNGLFLRTPADDISAMSRHRGYHSTYNEFVKTQLDAMDISQSVDVLQKQVYDLQQNLKYLQQSGLPLYPSQGATVDLWQRSLERIQ